MHLLAAFLWFLAAPFWESKAHDQWSNDEVQTMFVRSPWVNVAFPVGSSGSRVPLPVYLASAKPMQDAEAEVDRRGKRETDPLNDEYRLWAKQNEGKYMVLAVLHPRTLVTLDSKEVRRMESECLLRIGRKTHRMVMHFSSSPSDARMRLIFPRAVQPTDKEFIIELYLPSISAPYREVTYTVKDLYANGKLEY